MQHKSGDGLAALLQSSPPMWWVLQRGIVKQSARVC